MRVFRFVLSLATLTGAATLAGAQGNPTAPTATASMQTIPAAATDCSKTVVGANSATEAVADCSTSAPNPGGFSATIKSNATPGAGGEVRALVSFSGDNPGSTTTLTATASIREYFTLTGGALADIAKLTSTRSGSINQTSISLDPADVTVKTA